MLFQKKQKQKKREGKRFHWTLADVIPSGNLTAQPRLSSCCHHWLPLSWHAWMGSLWNPKLLLKGVVTHGAPTPSPSHPMGTHGYAWTAATGMGSVPCSGHRWDTVYAGPPSSAFAAELPLWFPVFEPLIWYPATRTCAWEGEFYGLISFYCSQTYWWRSEIKRWGA